jgi:hypothetical protein
MAMFQAALIDRNFEGIFEQHRNVCPLAKPLSDSETAKVNSGGSKSRIVRYYMIEF